MKALKTLTIAAVLIGAAISVSAQPQAKPDTEELNRRLAELEAKVKLLTDELAAVRSLAGAPTAPSAAAEKRPAAKAETVTAAAQAAPKKDLGVDVGSARLTPYGTIYFNAFGNSGGTNNADVPMWATVSGPGNAGASMRQTRLGLRLEGARVGKARLGAVLEADFFGGIPGIGVGENFGVVRIRLANAKLDWEKTSLTVGQDWMPFAPLNPTSLAAAAIPQMAAAGNNWARLPQVKVERRLNDHVTWQGALLAPQSGDSSTTTSFLLQPNSGMASRTPYFQSRLAYSGKNWFASKKAGSIAASAHFGRSSVFLGAANVRHDENSWGVAADWNLPLSDVVAITGEAFAGQGLGGFQAGIFQSLNTDFARIQGIASTAGGVRAIRTRGGWVQLAVTPRMLGNKLGIYGTFGTDDPNDHDLTSVANRDWRQRNMAFAGEMIYKFTPQFQIGVEARRFQTLYLFSRRQTATHINLAMAYTF